MASTADIKKGLCIHFNHNIYQIVDFQHVKPGKGPAFVRTKLKNLVNGKVVDNTFPSGHKIETARIERRVFQFLYSDSEGFHFMNNETFEQITLQKDFIGNADFLKDGDNVDILYHAETEQPMICELPQFVHLRVSYTEPGVRGDTATNVTKPATLETGATLQVPLFVNEGTLIKIDTQKRVYVERVKE